MDLSHDRFYKTIEEAKTTIKQYSKVHYFIRLIRSRRIKIILFVGDRLPTNTKTVFVANRPPTNKKNVIHQKSSPTNKKIIRLESSR